MDDPKISRDAGNSDPEIGPEIPVYQKDQITSWRRRIVIGWNHQDDTPHGRESGKIWCWVTDDNRLQVFDENYNRSGIPGDVSFCGVANFTMVRMFHPSFAFLGQVPRDMQMRDKRWCRYKYKQLIRKSRRDQGLPIDLDPGNPIQPANGGPSAGHSRAGQHGGIPKHSVKRALKKRALQRLELQKRRRMKPLNHTKGRDRRASSNEPFSSYHTSSDDSDTSANMPLAKRSQRRCPGLIPPLSRDLAIEPDSKPEENFDSDGQIDLPLAERGRLRLSESITLSNEPESQTQPTTNEDTQFEIGTPQPGGTNEQSGTPGVSTILSNSFVAAPTQDQRSGTSPITGVSSIFIRPNENIQNHVDETQSIFSEFPQTRHESSIIDLTGESSDELDTLERSIEAKAEGKGETTSQSNTDEINVQGSRVAPLPHCLGVGPIRFDRDVETHLLNDVPPDWKFRVGEVVDLDPELSRKGCLPGHVARTRRVCGGRQRIGTGYK